MPNEDDYDAPLARSSERLDCNCTDCARVLVEGSPLSMSEGCQSGKICVDFYYLPRIVTSKVADAESEFVRPVSHTSCLLTRSEVVIFETRLQMVFAFSHRFWD